MDNKINIPVFTKVFIISLLTFLIITNIISIAFLTPFEKSILYTLRSFFSLKDCDSISILLMLNIGFLIFVLVFFYNVDKKIKTLIQKHEKEKKDLIDIHKQEINKKNECIKNLSKLCEEISEGNIQKSEFFYNISHELKTPLTVILGAIQLIDQKNSCVTIEKRNSSRQFIVIKQNCYRLLRLINNILDLSRIESGYIKVNTVNCNIVYLVEEITQSVVPYAEQKNLHIEFDTTAEEIISCVDIDKFDRILLNLLSNAIKYTKPRGKIFVNVFKSGNDFLIKISDTGIGIPKKKVGTIFERYLQVKNSFTKGVEGTGIGLSIVKSFVELHNGSIQVKSTLNKGSEFLIKIPIAQCTIESEKNYRKESNERIIDSIKIEFSDIYTISQSGQN
ncbi:HAMP domain-containing sensor histidine kinase [Herbivorax sp. ANBcel31]|uniref:sensor histidine kinase n=1 Tax=Herbivorax sp. ANBcel31 TaxID=3069754 RepID=UPI0027B169E8|nr:HAMP domain-containing sensor histidine kinase [Herbivorax sp. ANBcel31]MDQ2086421.1 HAMP domain-containing sensor histidine kinase [Herbivorax sp. ANBcel31]